ncbi:Cell cycle control protein G10 family protein [Ceratocystis lukuohia]|uniref:Cell cycle control protein G10 family protein n=2 Tax=Ceratocystis TaxID=5157 RepID=A0A0F8B0Z2_CERFI|nr:Cell cycle control protein G10 family protein [Ceratocystis platani]
MSSPKLPYMARDSSTTSNLDSDPGRQLHSQAFPALAVNDRPRLGIPTSVRLLAAGSSSFAAGALLGMTQGGRMAQLRFRAEHAHKMPSTMTGWYLYHKSKNYHAAQGAIVEGVRMGCRLGVWTTAVFALEQTVDRYRGRRDLVSTVLASLTVAGLFSVWNRFNMPTFTRTARYGLAFGLAYGGLQDAVFAAQGNASDLSYVELTQKLARRAKTMLEGDTK